MTAGRPRRARKIDRNQPGIVDALRRKGFSVIVVNGDVDLLVGWAGTTLPVEVKHPDGKGLNARQVRLWEDWKGSYLVAETADEIFDWFSENVVRK